MSTPCSGSAMMMRRPAAPQRQCRPYYTASGTRRPNLHALRPRSLTEQAAWGVVILSTVASTYLMAQAFLQAKGSIDRIDGKRKENQERRVEEQLTKEKERQARIDKLWGKGR